MQGDLVCLINNEIENIFGGQKVDPNCLVRCYGECDLSIYSLTDWDQYDGKVNNWVAMCRENCADSCRR